MGKSVPDLDTPPVPELPNKTGVKGPQGSETKIVKYGPAGKKTIISAPKISFVGGTQLHSTMTGLQEDKILISGNGSSTTDQTGLIGPIKPLSEVVTEDMLNDKNLQPVGLEYIEESMNASNTAASFYCKLCDCSFTDAQAKYMHSKGGRHRLQYKKKVDPTLQVEVKAGIHSMGQLERMKRRAITSGEHWRRREIQDLYKSEAESLKYEKELLKWQIQKSVGRYESSGLSVMYHRPAFMTQDMRPNLVDDNYFMMKHTQIYPTAEDLDAVQRTIGDCEKALKLVSDYLSESETPSVKVEEGTEKETTDPAAESKPVEACSRSLKGVMRVGALAKGLLLHNCLDMEVVVLCADKPTYSLLNNIYTQLPIQLETFAETKYSVELSDNRTQIIMSRSEEPCTKCTISLTSPVINADPQQDKQAATQNNMDKDILDKETCLQALASLRHAKWFQAKVTTQMPSCVVVIRVLLDFCQRVPTWNPLTQWAIELISEKVVSSYVGPRELTPAELFMRFFELIASGVFLNGGPGLLDPCEKVPTDAMANVTVQEIEDITNSAQHALRMIACGQLRRVLNLRPPQPAAELQPGTEVAAKPADGGEVTETNATPPIKRQKTET